MSEEKTQNIDAIEDYIELTLTRYIYSTMGGLMEACSHLGASMVAREAEKIDVNLGEARADSLRFVRAALVETMGQLVNAVETINTELGEEEED